MEKFEGKRTNKQQTDREEEEKSDGSEVCVMCFILICILQVNYYIISLSLSLFAPSLASLSFLSLFSTKVYCCSCCFYYAHQKHISFTFCPSKRGRHQQQSRDLFRTVPKSTVLSV